MSEPSSSAAAPGSKNSRKPKYSRFTQQELPACKPLLTPGWVIAIFILIGAIFIPIGAIALLSSNNVVEIVRQYETDCIPQVRNNEDRIQYIQDFTTNKSCTLELTVPKKMQKPVYVYYQLDNYYQNHRRYVKSRSDKQLLDGSGNTDSCKPLKQLNNSAGSEILPCGLIAWSLFNDTYKFSKNGQDLLVNKHGISWKSDRDHKFGTNVFPRNFPNNVPNNDTQSSNIGGAALNESIPLNQQEDLIVWIRTAALPTFRKLWGKIETTLQSGDKITVDVQNLYNTYEFGGKKKLVLSTTSWLGGKNNFLGIAYLTVGVICIFLALVFFFIHYKTSRPLGDTSYLSWNRKGSTAFIKLQQMSSGASSKVKRILLAVLLPLTFVATVSGILIATVVHRRKVAKKQEEQLMDAMLGLPKRFSYNELSSATSNFSKKLGRGGFGSVFQGTLPDGSRVAVKRLESAVQGHKEFRTEVVTIGSIHHVNLVQLRGFCAEKDHRLLVYEHVANGSLDRWLFHKGSDQTKAALSWEVRIRIALGTARGLAYLHEGCRQRIIHLDIKPENILLDESFDAKVCDFGMSRLMKREESEVFTMMRGTRGYMAPEWLQSSITEKADVYSFGVVLLELVSGQRCLDNDRVVSSQRYFPSYANQLMEQGRLVEIIDRQLHQQVDVIREQATVLVRLALHCLQEDPAKRPSMGSLVQMLEPLMINTTYMTDEYREALTMEDLEMEENNHQTSLASVFSEPWLANNIILDE